jgi:hypothetical protein
MPSDAWPPPAANGRPPPACSVQQRRYHALGIEQFPDHRGEHEQAVAAARAGLGDEAFPAAWEAGQALAPEHAVTEARAVTAAPVSATNR